MTTWEQLAGLTDEQLARHDVAAVNLACAQGLPGAPTAPEAARCLQLLDEFAEVAWDYTVRNCAQHTGPGGRGEAYGRASCMVSALWKRCGVRYNPAKVDPQAPLATADSFVHGALLGEGGTCASLPVLYAAVGRRLGYPIRLVSARRGAFGHLFCRWDDPGGERFNVEVNPSGMATPPDEYYRTGPYALTDEQLADTGHLRSFSPREELAFFLCERGFCWRQEGNHRRAAEALAWAAALRPAYPAARATAVAALAEWEKELRRAAPPGFPPLCVTSDDRRFPESVPAGLERDVLTLEAVETLLRDPEFERDLWGPMRRGQTPAHAPSGARAHFAGRRCQVSFCHDGAG